jgi:hypothetical protein
VVARDRNAVVAVAQDVLVAEPVDRDRRKRHAARLRHPQPLPAVAGRAVGPQLGVEAPRLRRLDRPGHRGDRDELDAERAPLGDRRPARAVVEDAQAAAGAAPDAPAELRAAPPAQEAPEAVVGLGRRRARVRHHRVQRQDDRGDGQQRAQRAGQDDGQHDEREAGREPAPADRRGLPQRRRDGGEAAARAGDRRHARAAARHVTSESSSPGETQRGFSQTYGPAGPGWKWTPCSTGLRFVARTPASFLIVRFMVLF